MPQIQLIILVIYLFNLAIMLFLSFYLMRLIRFDDDNLDTESYSQELRKFHLINITKESI